LFPLALINKISDELESLKVENNLIMIDDFNRIISEIAAKEPIPFVYERVGEKYDHFLIDEFQDTSVLQWNNLLPLIHNSLSKGFFNMIVGDAKQAIYRFRNGDVEQFAALPELKKIIYQFPDEDLIALQSSLIDNYSEIVLDKNYRSQKEIVDFNNKFFSEISSFVSDKMKYININEIYKNLTQKSKDDFNGGYINIEFLPPESSEVNFNNEQNITEASIANEEYQKRTFEIIENLLKHNKCQLSDIAILFRSNFQANSMANYLVDNNINVVSAESLLLTSSADVKFLIDITKFFTNTSDFVSRAAVLSYLIKSKIIDKEFDECINEIKSADFNQFVKLISNKDNELDYFDLIKKTYYDFIENIIRYYKIEKPDPFIRHFLDCTYEYSSSGINSISDFIEWWEENKTKKSVILPEGNNAVKILTIHKSKGLQFPVVIYPYASEQISINKDYEFVDTAGLDLKDLPTSFLKLNKGNYENTFFQEEFYLNTERAILDMLNLAYVAFTRAEDRLYIISKDLKERSKLAKTEDYGSIKSLNILLLNFIYKTRKNVSDEDKVFEFGDVNTITEKRIINTCQTSIDKIISENWSDKISIKYKSSDYWDVEDADSKKEYGNLLHFILSEIKSKNEVADSINTLSRQGIIAEPEVGKITEIISKIVNHNQLSIFFEEGLNVKNETEIIDENGSSYRPDRLIIYSDKVVIIDYKSGSKRPYHFNQINHYGNLLKEIEINKKIEKYLVYLNDDIEVENV